MTFIGAFALLILILAIVSIFMVVLIYNRLVGYRNRYKNSFAQIDVQLKRRYDLIPNLVETAKGYLKHEAGTLEAVVKARAGATAARENAASHPGQASAMQHLAGADGALSGALGRLLVVMEQYPDLKADKTIAQLMEELTSTENRLSFARQAYNDSVTDYNQAREMFPAVLFANSLSFDEANLWQPPDREEPAAPPTVSFTG